jgi:hypothetical protein
LECRHPDLDHVRCVGSTGLACASAAPTLTIETRRTRARSPSNAATAAAIATT